VKSLVDVDNALSGHGAGVDPLQFDVGVVEENSDQLSGGITGTADDSYAYHGSVSIDSV